MGRPIVNVTAMRFTEAWHQLSKEEQSNLMAKIEAHREQITGLKSIAFCRALDNRWEFLVIDEYPDMDAMIKLAELDAELESVMDFDRAWYAFGYEPNSVPE